MAVSQILIDRPGLNRALSAVDLADPLHFFEIEHSYLADILRTLSAIADDLHCADRCARAGAVADYFRLDFPLHIEDEAAMLDLLERDGVPTAFDHDIVDEMRAEHLALRRMLPPIADGLEEISITGMPLAPSRFVIDALVLSEFLRLHVGRVRRQLMPLAATVLGARMLDDLARGMASRRGMGPC
jgi:hypothetical protein